MDSKIVEAIEEAVSEAGQPVGLARKMSRWFDAVSSGNEDVASKQDAYRHLELLYAEATLVGTVHAASEADGAISDDAKEE
ncbi:MAG: hypothetical protein OXI01_24780 [Albidovulum sp.]|nr:hypothetical protein [Albidovulum sp.]